MLNKLGLRRCILAMGVVVVGSAIAVFSSGIATVTGQSLLDGEQRTWDQRIARLEVTLSERGEHLKVLEAKIDAMDRYNDALERSGLRGVGLQVRLTETKDRIQLLMWIFGALGTGMLTLMIKSLSVVLSTHGIVNSRWDDRVAEFKEALADAKSVALASLDLAKEQGRAEGLVMGRAESQPVTIIK